MARGIVKSLPHGVLCSETYGLRASMRTVKESKGIYSAKNAIPPFKFFHGNLLKLRHNYY